MGNLKPINFRAQIMAHHDLESLVTHKKFLIEPIQPDFPSSRPAACLASREDDKSDAESTLEAKLKETRSTLAAYYPFVRGQEISKVQRDFLQVLNLFDPFRCYKYRLAETFRIQNISNAWLKLWELFTEFQLIPASFLPSESYITFSNAALPGAAILAINHYVKTMTTIKSHVWYAGAHLDDSSPNQDLYGLGKNYRKRWLTDEKHNGDLTQLENIHDIKNKLSQGSPLVHFYTSDLETDLSDDYTTQELQHARANLGQLLLGLLILRPGGNLLVKQYSFFSPFSRSLISLCSRLFGRFYLSKPASSRVTNGETYLVGIGYKGTDTGIIGLLEQRLGDFSLDAFPEVKIASTLTTAAEDIYGLQLAALNLALELYREIVASGDSRDSEANEALKKIRTDYRARQALICTAWIGNYPLTSLRQKDRLHIRESLPYAFHPAPRG